MRRRILLIFSLFIAIIAKADIEPAENQIWWGYFADSDASGLSLDDGYLGNGSACTLDAAIRVPANDDFVGGSTIKAIRFWLANDISGIKTMRIWIATKKPTGATTNSAYRQTVLKSNLVGGLNEIELNTPFEVNNREIYVGYTITTSKKCYPIMGGGTTVPDGFFYRIGTGTSTNVTYGSWYDFYADGYDYGKLALQLLIEAESFPTNRAIVEDFGQKIVERKTSVSIPITIINKGMNPVKSIGYTITSENGSILAQSTKSFSTAPIAMNGKKSVNITFPLAKEAIKYPRTFTVTTVNGEPNTASNPSADGFIINLTKKASVTPVVEEFTGTWCGWCPRGMVGMEKVNETYGDQVVQIAAHYGDIMAITAYQPVINTFVSGFPSSLTDRQFEADPSFSTLKSALTSSWNRVSQGAIELSAEWEDADQSAVSFSTKTTFGYNDVDGNYAIAFVLTEDGLKGTGSDWIQQNYYSGMTVAQAGADMAWWCSAGSTVSGLEFNHVPVAAWEALYGVDGSVSNTFEADKVQKYSFVGDISNVSLIQDKSKLKAIALLIDRVTGTVVNAAHSDIVEHGTAISSVRSDERVPAARYSIDGRQLQTSQRGLNIIRMSDGSVKKVLVK